jgi:hypothetical protein
MNMKIPISAILLIATIVTVRASDSIFDEPATSIRIPGKSIPAPIDLWVEGEIAQLDADAATFTVRGRRMTFIHAYDVKDPACPITYDFCDKCDPPGYYGLADPPSAQHCDCTEIIVRNINRAAPVLPPVAVEGEEAPPPLPPYGETLDYAQAAPIPATDQTLLNESQFNGTTNLHPNNQLIPLGYIDDPQNCPCDQTILSPRTGPAFTGAQRAEDVNEKTEETPQNVSFEDKDKGLSYPMTAVSAKSLKDFKVGDHVMVGFAVNDDGNRAYTIIRQR